MPDPKLDNAQIVRNTRCRVGTHWFTYTKYEPDWIRCDCGAYTLSEWENR